MSRRFPIGLQPRLEASNKTQLPNPDAWVTQEHLSPQATTRSELNSKLDSKAEVYSARLTVDITPALRVRIKVFAYQSGKTVTEVLRELLEQNFPEDTATGEST